MAQSRSRSVLPFVLFGLVLSLVIAVVVSNFAAESPDALQRAIIDSACQGTADEEACLVEQEGEPVLGAPSDALNGYEVTWLSGLVGVFATFFVGAGIVYLLRRSGDRRPAPRVG